MASGNVTVHMTGTREFRAAISLLRQFVDYGNQQYVADEDMESLMAEAETFLEHGLDASPPVDTEALWTDPHPRTNEGRRMLEDFIQRGPRAWDVRDLGQRICQIENEALAALDGEPR